MCVHRCSLVVVVLELLDHDEEKVLIRGDHNFLFAGAHSEESQVIEGLKVANDRSGLESQLGDLLGDSSGVELLVGGVHGRAQGLAVIVDDQESLNAFMVFDSENALFNFSHFDATVCLFSNLITDNLIN